MSDPISLSLAIAPLVIEAFKGFRTLNSKLRIFSHYSQELKRIRTRFEAQQDFFQSECEILFRKVTDSQSEVEAFLQARQLNNSCHDTLKRLCAYLGTRQKAFQGTFEEIKASLEDLEAELLGFEQFESIRQDGESLKDAVRRLRYRLKITINKTEKHAQELRRDRAYTQDVANDMKPLPLECSHFGRVRLAALAFHEAMVTHWVCEIPKHYRHLIRLFTNVEVQHDVRMNFFLLGEWNLPGAIGPKRSDFISLQVRSTIVEFSNPRDPGHREIQQQSCTETIGSRLVKRRRVWWVDKTGEDHNTSATSDNHSPSNLNSHSLMPHEGVDSGSNTRGYQRTGIPSCVIATRQLENPACLGHLDVEMRDPFRHSFYTWSSICNGSTKVEPFNSAKPLASLFEQPADMNFDMIDQLLMAKTMVATILKFHSTPWLGSWWTLKDLHYLANHSGMKGVLNTLHLGATIEMKRNQVCEQHQPLALTRGAAEGSGRCSQRIRNTVLHNLGVGLLQIDRWKDLDPNSIDEIDKLAKQRSKLGPKYRDLVQKCLYCDFGVGADLLKPQLQTAILDKVVRELESMVAGLKLDDDDDEAGESRKIIKGSK
ncbi:hypothetical protein F4825DRAFT_464916 [Nemania diffusa]|nr:hypothetical protein F4825DRAFT_464916 [Nemania diffusa]